MKKQPTASVLIYTLVLVVLSVLMAMGVLNMAQKLSLDYDTRVLDNSLISEIRAKKDLVVKYTNFLNNNGSGFTDLIGCPQSITMSGNTVASATFSTDYVYSGGIMSCQGEYNSENVDVYFNSGGTDTYFLEYQGSQLVLNSSNFTGVLTNTDQTIVDASGSFPLLPDNIDDDFNSDNYAVDSGAGVKYASGFIDDDARMRIENFGYIVEGRSWYNTFWLNSDIRQIIEENSNNIGPSIKRIGDVSSGRMFLDMDKSFALRLYELDSESYTKFSEMKILNMKETASVSTPEKGYLQDDMSLSPIVTGNEFEFDFVNKDYALFTSSYGSGTLLYKLTVEDTSGAPVYSVPLKDDEPGFLSYVGSHIIIDSSQRLVAKISKLVSFKSQEFSNIAPSGPRIPTNDLVGWYDFSLPYITQSGGRVSSVQDRSINGRDLLQLNNSIQPFYNGDGITGNGYLGSYLNISNPTGVNRVYMRVSYPYSSFQGHDYLFSGNGSWGSPRISGFSGNTTLLNSQTPTDIQVSKNGGPYSLDFGLPLNSNILTFRYSNPVIFSRIGGTTFDVNRSFKGTIHEVLLYSNIPTSAEETRILDYLSQ